MCTDNPIILQKTRDTRTIMCMQKSAKKKVVTEDDIIAANKIAFNDDIGVVTNHITSMIERQAAFPKDSEEYKILDYRIMCGQHFQQNTIDRAKGIVSKPMPYYWYNRRLNLPDENDDPASAEKKAKNLRIVADRKPYFMTYIYPDLKKQYRDYVSAVSRKRKMMNQRDIEELYNSDNLTEEEQTALEYYERFLPAGMNPCVVNRISWLFEETFKSYLKQTEDDFPFNYKIYKSNCEYSESMLRRIEEIYEEYKTDVTEYQIYARKMKVDKDARYQARIQFIEKFRENCSIICPNEKELCNILVDICYKHENSKQFAWDICGDVMLENLLAKNDSVVEYPQMVDDEDYDFKYAGYRFKMNWKVIEVKDC